MKWKLLFYVIAALIITTSNLHAAHRASRACKKPMDYFADQYRDRLHEDRKNQRKLSEKHGGCSVKLEKKLQEKAKKNNKRKRSDPPAWVKPIALKRKKRNVSCALDMIEADAKTLTQGFPVLDTYEDPTVMTPEFQSEETSCFSSDSPSSVVPEGNPGATPPEFAPQESETFIAGQDYFMAPQDSAIVTTPELESREDTSED